MRGRQSYLPMPRVGENYVEKLVGEMPRLSAILNKAAFECGATAPL